MLILLRIAKYGLRFLYLFLRPLRVRNKVVFFSRQSSEIPLDFRLLAEELGAPVPGDRGAVFLPEDAAQDQPGYIRPVYPAEPVPPGHRLGGGDRYLFHPTVHPGVQAGPDHCPDLGTPWGR